MTALLRSVRSIAVVVWVGGIVFFAFVVAPVAFLSLPTAHEAGIVVRGTINVLHTMGGVCGIAFVLATLGLLRATGGVGSTGYATTRHKVYLAEIALAAVMFLVTAFSQMAVIGPMEFDRVRAGGVIEAVSEDDPARVDFERRHVWSERLEGFVLLCGLTLVVAMSCEPIATGRS